MFSEKIPLKEYTSFKIGGPAKYFFEAKNTEELIKALQKAKELKIPVCILGGGSKVLVSDEGFNGLVIKILYTEYSILNTKITADAGVNLSRLVAESIKNNLSGLEWAIGIPGTIGGAIHGNCGAFGSSISKAVEKVIVLNPKTLKIKEYANKQCRFGYRDSIFKHDKNIIISIELRLEKGSSQNSQKIIKENLQRRKERIPSYPSCGSIFKNIKFESLSAKTKKLVRQIADETKIKGGMLPAGHLIEKCDLKGKQIGGAKISEQQANIIINFSHAKAKDVSALINLAKKQVNKKFGINLEEEVIYLP